MKYAIAFLSTFMFDSLYATTLSEINTMVDTKQISIYKVSPESKYNNYGTGLFYNTPNVKVKVEDSDTAFKTGAVLNANPFKTPIYFKVGANYLDQNIQESDSIVNNVNQYSSGLACGYMLYNDLSVELGSSISKLHGYDDMPDGKSKTYTAKDTYTQIGKRFETPIGTIDTLLNKSQLYNTLSTSQQSYSSSFDYYLNDNFKFNYLYTLNQNNIQNRYGLYYSYLSTEYTQNLSQDSYYISLGLKARFSDIMKFSSYKPSVKKTKRFSKSHKFDDVILQDNMNLHL
jgi:hypothetical protein